MSILLHRSRDIYDFVGTFYHANVLDSSSSHPASPHQDPVTSVATFANIGTRRRTDAEKNLGIDSRELRLKGDMPKTFTDVEAQVTLKPRGKRISSDAEPAAGIVAEALGLVRVNQRKQSWYTCVVSTMGAKWPAAENHDFIYIATVRCSSVLFSYAVFYFLLFLRAYQCPSL